MRIKSIVFSFLLVLFFSISAFAGDLTVVVAANVQYTFEELKAKFQKETGINLSGNSPPVKAGMRAVPETQSLDKQSLKLKNKSSPLAVKPGISRL